MITQLEGETAAGHAAPWLHNDNFIVGKIVTKTIILAIAIYVLSTIPILFEDISDNEEMMLIERTRCTPIYNIDRLLTKRLVQKRLGFRVLILSSVGNWVI
ncbi:hypothetical protein BABINDRAFT_169500 [Babjeviella inositovora NRRL Y-12698]|uniref:Uncharacterized protein n=1 Tax=Babjeviella inositovora NRRL Y-12698 TaxID=984486 RepID=A0A1E3QHA2_9ASCO|nr:uncharacterized protein BABINDRAFT_169500 [Babjeviella inositovora NRRL Y-12698]ODQ76978.1 hypothetical protein BABINDRAFT_169500 [Babjeviella inositovora NRRL Y-12698]